MIDSERFILDCTAIRTQNPLIHNITNYVAMNFAANSLLAIGASPLMSFYPEEMDEVVGACSAVAINIGCLNGELIRAGELAAKAALRKAKPWVLDPAGAGVSAARTQTACHLAMDFHPSIIRGNAAELHAMLVNITGGQDSGAGPAENHGYQRGVDCIACNEDWSRETAVKLALATGGVVAAGGPVGCVTDGKRVLLLAGGHPMMAKITAMGCSESAVCAAFSAVDRDPFHAAANAMALMDTAGEIAYSKTVAMNGIAGTGSFQCAFLDALSTMDAAKAASMIKER